MSPRHSCSVRIWTANPLRTVCNRTTVHFTAAVAMLWCAVAHCADGVRDSSHFFFTQYRPRPEAKPASPETANPRPANSATLADVVEKAEGAVVKISTNRGMGTGFVVRSDGWVVTSLHVVEGARRATIAYRDKSEYEVLGYDAVLPGCDLILLRIRTSRNLSTLPIADSPPRKMEKVVTIGNPKGFSFTTSSGDVSAIRTSREIGEIVGSQYRSWGHDPDSKWIQTTAPISSGNSGGPLLDSTGRVVGVCTWVRTDGQNLNFAVDASHVHVLMRAGASAVTRGLDTLPKPKSEAEVARDGDYRIPLPSGKILSLKAFEFNYVRVIDWFTSCATSRTKIVPDRVVTGSDGTFAVVWSIEKRYRFNPWYVISVTYPNGEPFAFASHDRGALDEYTIGRHDNGELMVCIRYEQGKRCGPMQTWDAMGREVYFCQYDQGRRDGFCCLFDDAELRLICECKADHIQTVHLVEDHKVEKSFASTELANADPEAARLVKKLTDTEKEMLENEKKLKKVVKEEFEKIQEELVRQNRLKSRQEIIARINQNRAQNADAMRGFRDRYGIKAP